MTPAVDDQNLALVRRMGSTKGYDPIPPDNYLVFLKDEDPIQRVIAWVRAHTIRHKHRSPWAVDEHGNILCIQDLANDCFGGDRSNAARAWSQAAAKKVVYMDEQGRLCLSGSIPSVDSLQNQSDNPKKQVCTDWISVCTDWFGEQDSALKAQVQAIPEDRRAEFAAEYGKLDKWAEQVQADAIAAARAAIEAREKLLFGKFGIRRRYLKKREKDRKPVVQLELLLEPEDVQTESVYKPDSGGLYNGQNGAVQTDPTLFNTEDSIGEAAAERVNGKAAAAPPPQPVAGKPQPEAPPPDERSEQIADLLRRRGYAAIGPKLLAELVGKLDPDTTVAYVERVLDDRMAGGNRPGTGALRLIFGDIRHGWREQERTAQNPATSPPPRRPGLPTVTEIRAQWAEMTEQERAIWIKDYPELGDSGKAEAAGGGHET